MPSAENVSGVLPPGLTLIPAHKLDPRSDEEIATWLQQRHEVTSEKNIWTFWHAGFTKSAPWVQRSIINWVRRLGPSWTVHCLDAVKGSETDVRNYLEDSFFPQTFLDGTMDGPFVGTHQADIIRLPLIWKYGGVWLDAGVYLFRHMDDICWRDIEDPETPYEVSGALMKARKGTDGFHNAFIAAKRHNPFIKRWHDVYLKVWGTNTNSGGTHKHPLFRHLPLVNPAMEEDWNSPALTVPPEDFTDYLQHVQAFERVRTTIDPNDGFDGNEYWTKRFRFTQALQDLYLLQYATSWDGQIQHDMLSRKRTGDDVVKDAAWQESEDMVNNLLANSSMMKLSRAGGVIAKPLVDLWSSPEHHDGDVAKDTFAAYLRYGSVHFDQLRKLTQATLDLGDSKIHTIGLFEPVPVENGVDGVNGSH